MFCYLTCILQMGVGVLNACKQRPFTDSYMVNTAVLIDADRCVLQELTLRSSHDRLLEDIDLRLLMTRMIITKCLQITFFAEIVSQPGTVAAL
jgi:hypothetical protein